MDCSSEKVDENNEDIDECIKRIEKMLPNTDEFTKQDLILIIATHIKHNIEKALYYSKESTKYYGTVMNQYKTLERLLDIKIKKLDVLELYTNITK